MKVIVVGCGKIGRAVSDALDREGHDITVIERDAGRMTQVANSMDIICVHGSGSNPETLSEAGAAEAELLLAATDSDELNMVSAIAAHKLGTKHVVARIRDTEYLDQTDFLRESLGLDMVVNPEYECAKEISRILRFPSAVRVDTFSKGSVEIVEHKVALGSRLDGMMLRDIASSIGAKVLVALVERGEEAFIPNGDFVIREGDTLSISGNPTEMRKFFVAIGQYRKSIKTAMLVGGGRTSVYLARLLIAAGIRVKIIDRHMERCRTLAELVPKADICCGDGTRSYLLTEEGIRSTDALVALTGDDGDNVIASLFAKKCGVGKIVTRINRSNTADILENTGLDTLVSMRETVAQHMLRYVRALDNTTGSSMETLLKFADGKVEAIEFKVREGARCTGIPLKSLKLRKGILISAVIRGNVSLIPDGNTEIRPGDHAVIVTAAGKLTDIDDIVEG